MSSCEDRLQKGPSRDRVFYATGMLLGTEDFTDEQLYHRAQLARALAYGHGSGTVAGLKVEWLEPLPSGHEDAPSGREEQLVVHPGLAIDRLGRLIELPVPACIRLDRWYGGQEDNDLVQGFHTDLGEVSGELPDGPEAIALPDGVVVDVFIRFVVCRRGKTPAFVPGPFDALDAVVPSRLRDGFHLQLVIRKEAEPPTPARAWPPLVDIEDDEEGRRVLKNAVLDAWREGSEHDVALAGERSLNPLPEHAEGMDTTSVFLARLVLPATAGPPPERLREDGELADMVVVNHMRPFVYTAGALASWIGIVAGEAD